MQIAFVLPLSMPLLLPVGLYQLNWFYPAMMILLGAWYTGTILLVFAALGRMNVNHECRANAGAA